MREAIEGALGTFDDAVQPRWGYIHITEQLVDSLTREDVMEMLQVEFVEGEQ